MFALARELEMHGVLERIYSGFPWASLARERVSKRRVKTFPVVRPIMMAAGKMSVELPHSVSEAMHYLSLTTLDAYVRSTLPRCDVFVGHEGAGLWSGCRAQSRGGVYVCDRGCSHMAWKEALLEAEYNRVGLKWPGKPRSYDRELAEYEHADLIVVPSNFAKNSFVESGIEAGRIAVVPIRR